ncbi:MAG TPA: ROK family protein [bacterium]|nr:ROK family protein [bacterium]
MARTYAIGVDLGGTKILTAVVADDGGVLARDRVATPQDGPDSVVEAVAKTVDAVVAAAGLARTALVGVGVGAPGPLNAQTGVVFQPPNLTGWHDVPFGPMLTERLRLPVGLANDANAAALGEWRFGAGRGIDDLVYLTISTGIGGGIIIGGTLLEGVSGTAGEIGHMTIDVNGPRCVCGNTGCLEVLAAGPAIARAAQAAVTAGTPSTLLDRAGGKVERITARVVAAAAAAGDALAADVFRRAATYVGVGVANLLNLLNPAMVIVGGGVSQAGDLLLEPIRVTARARAFERPARDARIVLAQLGDNVGAVGAAAVAFMKTGWSL